jgi:hypothetical protein
MVFVMYGIVLLIVLIAVAVAAMKDARLAKPVGNRRSQRSLFSCRQHTA